MKTIAFQMDDERAYEILKKFMDTKGIKLKDLGTRAIEHAVEIIEEMDLDKRLEKPATAAEKDIAKKAFLKELGLLDKPAPDITSKPQKEASEPEQQEPDEAEEQTAEDYLEQEEADIQEESCDTIESKEELDEQEAEEAFEELEEAFEEQEESEQTEESEQKVNAWDCESTKEAIKDFIRDNKRIPSQKEFKQINGLPSYKSAKRSLGRSPAEYCHECYDDLKKQGYIEQEQESEEENGMGMTM